MASVVPIDAQVVKPGTKDEMVAFKNTCVSGGVVNLYSSGTISTCNNKYAATLNIFALTVPTITTLNADNHGNVVNYCGAGAQNVKAQAYLNLTLSVHFAMALALFKDAKG